MKAKISSPAIALVCGAVFIGSVAPSRAGTFTQLYTFRGGKEDGANPQARLLQFGDKLYGTTNSGGLYDTGVLFSVDLSTGKETNLYSFVPPHENYPGRLIPVGGLLYGTTQGYYSCGTIYSFDPATGVKTTRNSQSPCSANDLTNAGGTLYGTITGDSDYSGAVFSYVPSTNVVTFIHTFGGSNDGIWPVGNLVLLNGLLYGATEYGGSNGFGTVFEINPTTGAEAVVYSFPANGGSFASYPSGIAAVDGTLYVTLEYGGGNAVGTILSLDPVSGAAKVVFALTGGHGGANPVGSVVSLGSLLYGVTDHGGNSKCLPYRVSGGCGIIFRVNAASASGTKLYSLNKARGDHPLSGVITYHGTLYGTTVDGGPENVGTVFSFKP